jgi:hypothetical protein
MTTAAERARARAKRMAEGTYYPPGQHPLSRAKLEAHRHPAPGLLARRCARCGRAALRTSAFCYAHSRKGVPNPGPGHMASRQLAGLDRLGLLPAALRLLPTWQALSPVPVAVRAPLRIALVLAWDKRDTEPMSWARLWREAVRVARDNVRPAWRDRPVPTWLDAR